MQALTLEEQIRQIAREVAKSENAELKAEIKLLKDAMAGEQVTREEAERIAKVGYRKLESGGVRPHKQGRKVTYSKLAVLEYAKSRELVAPPELDLSNIAA